MTRSKEQILDDLKKLRDQEPIMAGFVRKNEDRLREATEMHEVCEKASEIAFERREQVVADLRSSHSEHMAVQSRIREIENECARFLETTRH